MRVHPSMAAGLLCSVICGCAMSGENGQVQRDLRVADVELASGATSAALQTTESVVAAHPNDVDALVQLGNAQGFAGQDDMAENSFRRALHEDSGSFAAKFGLARLHLKVNADEALSELQDLARSAPDDSKVLTDLGVANDLTGRHDQAQTAYRRALAASPGLISAQADLGLSLALSNHVDQALAILAPLASSAGMPAKVRQDYALAVTLSGHMNDAQLILKQDLPTEQVALAINGYQDLRSAAQQ